MVLQTMRKRSLQVVDSPDIIGENMMILQTMRKRSLQVVDSLDITGENVMALQKTMTYKWQNLGDENRLEQNR